MTTSAPAETAARAPTIQWLHLAIASGLAIGVVLVAPTAHTKLTALFVVGLALGLSLYHASFGFTGAYRRLIQTRDMSGVVAQAAMLAVATLLFAPILATGEIFGHTASGAVAPVSVAMLTGAFVFGIGMQLGGGCASGTLFLAGGWDGRMVVTLIFFCAGSWLATLDMDWWRSLPSFGAVSLGREMGFGAAAALQIVAMAGILGGLWAMGFRIRRPVWGPINGRTLLRGPWPLLLGGLALALLNWAVLLIAGHPWGVTWGFTLWGAKAAAALGWDPATSEYWSVAWRAGALDQSIVANTTSLMNIGIVLGAMGAAALAGKLRRPDRIAARPLLAAVVGGLMLGYGARLAYGCNIGAFFSGVASTSLHGWAWIIAAIVGNIIGVRLRPFFRLDS